MVPDSRFDEWLEGLETRHLAELTFSEVARALRALSMTYVERRGGLCDGAVLAGAGKRAAFALFYGPLHYLLVRDIILALPGGTEPLEDSPKSTGLLVDLGCGSGAAGAAWAHASPQPPRILGIDRRAWVLGEAEWTYRTFGLAARTRRGDLGGIPHGRSPARLLAAFVLNELAPPRRDALLRLLLERATAGDRVLIVEPIARTIAPWWDPWRAAFVSAGGRADEWRVPIDLPPILAKLDRAAGLDHRALTARTLWIAPGTRHGR